MFFSVVYRSPHPNFCAFAALSSILDSKRSINLAQLVSPSGALPAELVYHIFCKTLKKQEDKLGPNNETNDCYKKIRHIICNERNWLYWHTFKNLAAHTLGCWTLVCDTKPNGPKLFNLVLKILIVSPKKFERFCIWIWGIFSLQI